MGVIELDAELEVLFDDVFDGIGGLTVTPRVLAYSCSNASASRSIACSER
jgi:hypothetical protein